MPFSPVRIVRWWLGKYVPFFLILNGILEKLVTQLSTNSSSSKVQKIKMEILEGREKMKRT